MGAPPKQLKFSELSDERKENLRAILPGSFKHGDYNWNLNTRVSSKKGWAAYYDCWKCSTAKVTLTCNQESLPAKISEKGEHSCVSLGVDSTIIHDACAEMTDRVKELAILNGAERASVIAMTVLQ